MGEHIRSRTLDEARDLNYPPVPERLVVGVYDNHTHLEISDGVNPLDYREHLDRASAAGVRGVVQVGNDLETSRWSAEIAAKEPRVLAAVALHPNEAPRYEAEGTLDAALAEIDELASRPRVRAIGETGRPTAKTPRPARHERPRRGPDHRAERRARRSLPHAGRARRHRAG